MACIVQSCGEIITDRTISEPFIAFCEINLLCFRNLQRRLRRQRRTFWGNSETKWRSHWKGKAQGFLTDNARLAIYLGAHREVVTIELQINHVYRCYGWWILHFLSGRVVCSRIVVEI